MSRLEPAILAAGYQAEPYWWRTADRPVPSAEPLPAALDTVVVGGGYTGLMCALEQARRGRSVAVLERDSIAAGASSRNGGIVHAGTKHELHQLLAMPGGRAMYDFSAEAVEGIAALARELDDDFAWEQCGHVELAHHPRLVSELEAAARAHDSIGVEAHVVRGDEVRAEVGSAAFPAGLVVPGSASVHPARLAAALGRAAVEAGAQVYTRTTVTAIGSAEPAGHLVRTNRGDVRARDVVVATNGYTDRTVSWLGRRILPIGSYIVATEPLSGDIIASVSPRRRVFFDTLNFLHYWRLSPDGTRVLFGGRTSFAPTTVERSRDRLARAMVEIHPQLDGVGIERAWGGNVALTVDRMPHLGRHPETGVVYAMGYCGTGVALATHFGRVVGRWLAGDGDLGPFADRAWRPVPAPAQVPWLLPVAGWWYQARDRLAR